MALLYASLRTRLLAAAPVAAVTTRIAWGIIPQGTALPYVRLTTISDPRPEHLKGYQSARVTRVQCDCFAATYVAARDLADKIIAALDAPATGFGRIKAEGPRDLGEDVPGLGYINRASVDLLVEHKLV